MPTANYWKLDNGEYQVVTDDGVFTSIMTAEELDRVRQEMSHLDWVEGEPEKVPKIGWTVQEYTGVEILSTPPGMSFEQLQDTGNWPEGFTPAPITEENALKVEDNVLVASLSGGYALYTVEASDGGLCGRSGGMRAFFEFGQDDRNCWVCSGVANVDAITKLELTR